MSNALRKQCADQLAEEERRRAKFWEREARAAEAECQELRTRIIKLEAIAQVGARDIGSQRQALGQTISQMIAMRSEIATWRNWSGELPAWAANHIERLDAVIATAQGTME